MNGRIKKGAAAMLSFSLIGTMIAMPGNVYAAEPNTAKEENVYAALEDDGSVRDIYVVNAYDLLKDTTIVDYGNYKEVKNLSNENKISREGNLYKVEAPKGKFYYQGELDAKNLPWNIQIRYYLDGKEIKGKELAGKSGALKIQIDLSQNKSVDESFFENYLLQVTVALPAERCTNIEASGATIANMAGDKQILFNVMGGQEKTLNVSADVTDFEMNAVSLKGVPMSFDIDTDELDTSELTDKTSELAKKVASLDQGVEKLQKGTEGLQKGLKVYTAGVDSIYNGAAALASGADELRDGTTNYTKAVGSISKGADTLAQKTEMLPALMVNLEDAVQLLTDGSAQLSDKNHGAAVQIDAALKEIEAGLVKMQEGLKAMNEKAVMPMLQGLDELEGKMSSMEGGLNALKQYAAALQKVQAEYQAEADALAEIIQSFDSLSGQTEENPAPVSGEAVAELNKLHYRMSGNAGALSGILNGGGSNPGLTDIAAGCEAGTVQMKEALFGKTGNSMKNALLALQAQITGEKGAAAGVEQMIAGVRQLRGKISGTPGSLQSNLESLDSGLQLLNQNVKKLPLAGKQLIFGVNQLQDGIHTLNKNSSPLVNGAASLNAGVKQLSSGTRKLTENNQTILKGMEGLSGGIGTLRSGTEEFVKKTSNMDSQIIDELKDGLSNFTNQEYEGCSYVSEENVNIDAVQFAMQTEAISIPKQEAPKEKKETPTMWEKLKALFQ